MILSYVLLLVLASYRYFEMNASFNPDTKYTWEFGTALLVGTEYPAWSTTGMKRPSIVDLVLILMFDTFTRNKHKAHKSTAPVTFCTVGKQTYSMIFLCHNIISWWTRAFHKPTMTVPGRGMV